MRAAIEEVNTRFVEAINVGDAAATAEIYTADCSVLPPQHDTIRGRRAVRDFFAGMVAEVGGVTTLTIEEIGGAGALAYQWLRYTLEAPKVSDAGRVVEVLKRQADGTWQIHLSIFNSEAA